MSDLISRESLKKGIEKVYRCSWSDIEKVFNFADVINGLPSAEPERKRGEWIYDTERVAGDGWTYSQYHCSECGFQELGGLANFCPHCGAEMTR